MVLLTVTEVVMAEGAVRTVVDPAEVTLGNVSQVYHVKKDESHVCPTGHVVTVDLTTSVT